MLGRLALSIARFESHRTSWDELDRRLRKLPECPKRLKIGDFLKEE